MTPASLHSVARFGDYEVDLRAGRLSKDGRKVELREKSFQVLALLLEHPGEVVTRDELRQRLWPADVFVDFDNNLNIAVARLRHALGDSSEQPRFIETLPKRGYRFIGAVSERTRLAAPQPAGRFRIVVLPFVRLSNDPSHDCLVDSVTDAMITALARVAPHLAVIARTTSMCYKDSRKDIEQIGRELGADYLLEGAVRFVHEHAWVNVQLVQAADQTHVFAQSYESTLCEIFDLQGRIAESVAAHIAHLGPAPRGSASLLAQPARRGTDDLAAYNFYLQARLQIQLCSGKPTAVVARAREYLEHALERDPHFALAHAASAELHWWNGFLGLARPREVFPKGAWAALRALEIDPTLAFPHALLGTFHAHLEYDWPEVEREMELAVRLDPHCPDTRFRYAASYLMQVGRFAEAIVEFETLLESDPLAWYPRFWLAWTHFLAREYASCTEHCRLLLELAPGRHGDLNRGLDLAHIGLGMVAMVERRFAEAVSECRAALELSHGLPSRVSLYGTALALNGNVTAARTLLDRLQADAAAGCYVPATTFAWIHYALGDIDAGLTWFERAAEDGEPIVVNVAFYEMADPLRTHPRFQALVRRMNLQPARIVAGGC